MMIWLVLLALSTVVAGDFYCADELQKCTRAAEQFESRVQEMKEEAFKKCFRRPSCHEEKKVFDHCYKATVRAMRAPFRKSNESAREFAGSIHSFRSTLDHCFLHSPFVPRRKKFGPAILDEDAVYARALYSGELADRVWGLPELGISRPSLDGYGVCRTPESSRVFGAGISRLMHSGDPKLNNLTSSCLLEESELLCYRQFLDQNQEYVQAVYQRDYAIRYCIQNVRTNTPCRMNDHSRLRSCICGAREEFDRNIQMDILDCVRHNSFHNQAVALASLHDSSSEVVQKTEKATASVIGVPKMTQFLTSGEMVNGQCMCACGDSITKQQMEVSSSISNIELNEDEGSFKEDAPRLMQPSEAYKHVTWRKRRSQTSNRNQQL